MVLVVDKIEEIGGFVSDTRRFRAESCNGPSVELWEISIQVANEHFENGYDATTEIKGYEKSFDEEPVVHAYKKVSLSSDDEPETRGENILEMFKEQTIEMLKRVREMKKKSKNGVPLEPLD